MSVYPHLREWLKGRCRAGYTSGKLVQRRCSASGILRLTLVSQDPRGSEADSRNCILVVARDESVPAGARERRPLGVKKQ